MFNTSLFLDRELELRLRREHLLHEQLSPDSSRPGPWLGRLGQWLGLRQEPTHLDSGFEAVEQELLVPDEHLALVLRDGLAIHLLEPGRHRFPALEGRLKVRWIHQDILPQGFDALAQVERLALAQRLRYERAFLFVDRRLAAVIRPPVNNRQGRVAVDRVGHAAKPAKLWAVLRGEAFEDPDELQRFSFV